MKEIDLAVSVIVGVVAAVMSFLAWVICRASGRTDDEGMPGSRTNNIERGTGK